MTRAGVLCLALAACAPKNPIEAVRDAGPAPELVGLWAVESGNDAPAEPDSQWTIGTSTVTMPGAPPARYGVNRSFDPWRVALAPSPDADAIPGLAILEGDRLTVKLDRAPPLAFPATGAPEEGYDRYQLVYDGMPASLSPRPSPAATEALVGRWYTTSVSDDTARAVVGSTWTFSPDGAFELFDGTRAHAGRYEVDATTRPWRTTLALDGTAEHPRFVFDREGETLRIKPSKNRLSGFAPSFDRPADWPILHLVPLADAHLVPPPELLGTWTREEDGVVSRLTLTAAGRYIAEVGGERDEGPFLVVVGITDPPRISLLRDPGPAWTPGVDRGVYRVEGDNLRLRIGADYPESLDDEQAELIELVRQTP